ncbi:MAG: GDP-mannose 4,6-dehydratase, partial [Gemmatimonadales bacterium]
GELYCRMAQRVEGGPSIRVVRPFNTYGPYQSAKAIIPELIVRCLAGRPVRTTLGEQTREFNFVTDVVDGLIRLADFEGEIDGPLNIAASEEIRIADLVTTIAELTATASDVQIGALPYRPTEIWRMYADSTRARELLGWAPQVSLREGLARTVEWFRGYPS